MGFGGKNMGATKIILNCLIVFTFELIVLSIIFTDVKLPATTMAAAGIMTLLLTLGFMVEVNRLKAKKTGGA